MAEQNSIQPTVGYCDYYQRCIAKYQRGLKEVLGGTGNGKTSGIRKLVPTLTINDRKLIYCANRVQLVQEMAEQLPKGSYVHLPSDLDSVRALLNGEIRTQFSDLLESRLLRQGLELLRNEQQRQLDLPQLRRTVQSLESLGSMGVQNADLEQLLRDKASQVVRFFQTLLAKLGSGSARSQELHGKLLAQPAIRTLFPYIEFRTNPAAKILLLTLQKAYQGFFDGKRTLNLARLRGDQGNFVIFLDEFDFLEHDLLVLLTEDEQISDPFHFVELFYGAMKRHKLPLDEYPVSDEIRQRIEAITGKIDKLQSQYAIHYPNINQFTTNHPDLRRAAIFQTARTMTSAPLYLRETARSFEILPTSTDSEGQPNLPALALFGAIHDTVNAIITLFKETETARPLIYEEVLRHCFQNTIFEQELRRIRQAPRQRRRQETRLGNLLDTGYTLFELVDLQQETDRDEVDFHLYTLYTTPEKIIAELATHNLVFGLSATVDIPRIVRQFNLEWIAKQGEALLIEVDEEDRALIQTLNQAKQQMRNNRLCVNFAAGLDTNDTYQQRLHQFIEAVAVDEEFGGNDQQGYRRQRVERFFALLCHLATTKSAEELATDTHLLFFSTFKQIKHIFARYPQPEDKLFAIKSATDNTLFSACELSLQGVMFIVIFYDAQYDRSLRVSATAMANYHRLFWQDKPVIVVTQYPSAGNGVNLQYLPSPESQPGTETDFKHIHLLEAPYFYFDRIEPEHTADERLAIVKRNIWYFAKLFEAKRISEGQFIRFLGNIRTSQLNDHYRTGHATTEDYLLNQIATYAQVIGRIERVWQPMPDQTVWLCREVYEAFAIYATYEQFEGQRTQRAATISNHFRDILAQIADMVKANTKISLLKRDERLATRNEQSRQQIGELLAGLVALRAGDGDNNARETWQHLRRDVLRHDFQSTLLRRFRAVFESPYYNQGILYVDQALNLYRPEDWQTGVHQWNLNATYTRISDLPVIRRHFERHGYELSFLHPSSHFFTPYCYQSVLLGAIGEEAIRAILEEQKIPLEAICDQLFELADLKIQGRPWYIDCKNYSEHTLEAFAISPDDPAWRPKLNEADFKDAALRKLAAIRRVHGETADAKLIYLNLVSHAERPKRYFDRNFNLVDDFQSAQIIVIQGILNSNTDQAVYNLGFEQFLSHLNMENVYA
ncbi:MAG: hypothetical protein R3E79_39750 [Caldilineaceae bacterium]